MNLKKFALRGLIVLAVVVALCMFFSGTIRTITTAKVKILSPKQGKLTQTVELDAKVLFPEAQPVKLKGAQDASLSILSLKVQPGAEVKKGDVLFTAEIADYEKSMATLRTSYQQVSDQLSELERKNRNLRLKRTDEEWAAAYEALCDAEAAELDGRVAVGALLAVEGLTVENDELPAGAGDELKTAWQTLQAAKTALAAAKANMSVADRYSIADDARSYIVDKKKYADQMADSEEQMVALRVLRATLSAVVAPEDGFVTEINVKEGETFDPRGVAYFFCSKENMPVLRVNTDNTTLNISKGTEVTFEGAKGKELDSKVISTGLTPAGAKYADVKLTSKLLKDMGGSAAVINTNVKVSVNYKSNDTTTLLPSSAVRGEGDGRYVYVLQEKQSAFGTNSLVVKKQDVKVLAEAGGVVSVSEDLSYSKVAYMEDREISEDTTVMEYIN